MTVPPHALTVAERTWFDAQGWLTLRAALDTATLERLTTWVDQIEDWATTDGPGLHHFERTDAGPALARSEDLLDHHPGLRAFLVEGAVPDWVSALLGEPAVLYKEKINYKRPGGAGFAPHQDATAYRFVDRHVSVMIPLDPMTVASGCLDFAPRPRDLLLPAERGCILPQVARSLGFEPVEAMPGDVVLFDSYTPHRSGPNTTSRARRALYLTYNPASRGDWRSTYYADKRAEFAAAGPSFDGTRSRISVNDDFLGRFTEERPRPRPRPIERLFDLYASRQANHLYDETVTELQHALQCADLASRQGASDALVAAALLHDVGHLLVGDLFPLDAALHKDWKHERVGARYLSCWFGPEVTDPVRHHVAAKRFLVATEPTYAATVSASSVRSLEAQGGAMTPAEASDFRALPSWRSAVALRRIDDAGKDARRQVPPFPVWRPLLERLAEPTASKPDPT